MTTLHYSKQSALESLLCKLFLSFTKRMHTTFVEVLYEVTLGHILIVPFNFHLRPEAGRSFAIPRPVL